MVADKMRKFQCIMLDILAKISAKKDYKFKHRMADLLTFLAYDILKIRKNYVIKSLQKHLKLDYSYALKLSRSVYKNFFLNSIEMAGLKYMTSESLLNRIEIEGISNLLKALSLKKGVIIVSGHFGLWELVPPWLTLNGFKVTIVVRRQNNKEVDKWMEEMRHKHGPETTDSGYGLRKILKALRKGHILALMTDQDNGKQGIFVKFLNEWASAPVGPAQISLKTGAPIVPLTMLPNYKQKHILKIFKPIYPDNFSNTINGQYEISQKYTYILEQLVKKYPKQWFWLHRRWKTRPKDCPDNPWAKLTFK